MVRLKRPHFHNVFRRAAALSFLIRGRGWTCWQRATFVQFTAATLLPPLLSSRVLSGRGRQQMSWVFSKRWRNPGAPNRYSRKRLRRCRRCCRSSRAIWTRTRCRSACRCGSEKGKTGSRIFEKKQQFVSFLPGPGISYVSQVMLLLQLSAASSSISFLFRLGFLA